MKHSAIVLTLLLVTCNGCVLLKTDERVDVVIAMTDLAAGRQITDKDITISSIPVSKFTRDMPRTSAQVLGRTTTVAISKGELVLLSEMK
jgi:Flp pilus assembly protein CpaB